MEPQLPNNLRYETKYVLAGEHQDSINCVAFSPTGEYLASGGSDCKIIFWSCVSGKMRQCFISESAVLALLWPTHATVIAGTANGLLMTFHISTSGVTVVGRHMQSGPIESLDITRIETKYPLLLSSGQSVVRAWCAGQNDALGGWTLLALLPPPPCTTPFSGDHSVRVTSAQWTNETEHHRGCVVVTYVHQGIICWKWDQSFTTAEIVWSIHTPMCGPAALSLDNTRVVVGNLKSGFSVYKTSSQECLGIFEVPTDTYDRCLPVIFVHRDKAILSGSAVGKVRLWDSNDFNLVQTLRHREADVTIIQALGASYQWDADSFLVATASSIPGAPNDVLLWTASKESAQAEEDGPIKERSTTTFE